MRTFAPVAAASGRAMVSGCALGLLLAAGAAFANGTEGAADQPGARSPVPATGIDEKPRRGTYAEATLGAFTTLGGSRTFSTGQPYLGLTLGREIGEAAALFASLGIGAVSNSCYQAGPAASCAAADSFGATFLEAGASYGVHLVPRVLLSAKVLGGLTFFSPGPFTQKDGTTVPDSLTAPHVGGGLGLDYETHLDHFGLGLDAVLRYSMVARPDGSGTARIPSFALMPRVRYVF